MDYQVLYTDRSLVDLEELIGWIAIDGSSAASRFGTTLLDHIDLLGRFPRMGAVYSHSGGVRRLVHGPILVYYTIQEDQRRVEVLHVRHGSRAPAVF